MKDIIALGVGHNTPVFLDLALSCGYNVSGLYHYNDDRTGEKDHGYTILGSFDDLWKIGNLTGKNFVLTMGDLDIREELSRKILSLGGELPTLIHPSSVISRFAQVSNCGVAIFPFTFVQSDCKVGDGTVLLSHVNISHNTTLGRFCFVAGGALVGAYTDVKDKAFIGQGSTTISGKVRTIGERAFIGAMSLATKDVESGTIVKGIPASPISK